MMDIANQILSDYIVFSKYARYLPEKGRRETWREVINRNKEMHLKRFPKLREEIENNYKLVYEKKVLPSLRSAQFAGKAIQVTPARIYNCSGIVMDDPKAFPEVMALLLYGCGVGVSVQKHHVRKLPELQMPKKRSRRFLIADSAEGWADAIKILMNAYFYGKSDPVFDFSDIRPKGMPLITSGGKAPGAEPLKECLFHIRKVLDRKTQGEKLKPIEIFDIICFIADAVLAGGIRRASIITLFSFDDDEMLNAKSGNWYELNPQRGRSNNSVVLLRYKVKRSDFDKIWNILRINRCGEPGFFFTNDKDWICNPCAEVSFKDCMFCNLTEINTGDIKSQEDFNQRAKVASFIGTLQASYTDFHYLREQWQENCEKHALIGVGLTGICSGNLFDYDLKQATNIILEENDRVAKLIGINLADRTTLVKPSGTSSLVLGTSAGIHSWFAPYYVRRIRLIKTEPVAKFFIKQLPELVEQDVTNSQQIILSIPQKAPAGAICRNHENPIDVLERIKRINLEWIRPGHRKGNNYNNCSATIDIGGDKEWKEVGDWLWNNRDFYTAISVINRNGSIYAQMPFEEITKEKYENLLVHLKKLDLKKIKEEDDFTNLQGELACGGGSCELL